MLKHIAPDLKFDELPRMGERLNPYLVVDLFEEALARYTGAPYVVALDSCTSALRLVLTWFRERLPEGVSPDTPLRIPQLTYRSVAMSALETGWRVELRNDRWWGGYQLWPLPVWDSACHIAKGMWAAPGHMLCLSFHSRKPLAIGRGGAILHDDPEFDTWARQLRFSGWGEEQYDDPTTTRLLGHKMTLMPSEAAKGLELLAYLPANPLPCAVGYHSLAEMELFQQHPRVTIVS